MEKEQRDWLKSAGLIGQIKKLSIIALMAIIGLAGPVYWFFVTRVFRQKR